MGYSVQFSGITHIGLHRLENQDNMVCNSRVITKNATSSEMVWGQTKENVSVTAGAADGIRSPISTIGEMKSAALFIFCI